MMHTIIVVALFTNYLLSGDVHRTQVSPTTMNENKESNRSSKFLLRIKRVPQWKRNWERMKNDRSGDTSYDNIMDGGKSEEDLFETSSTFCDKQVATVEKMYHLGHYLLLIIKSNESSSQTSAHHQVEQQQQPQQRWRQQVNSEEDPHTAEAVDGKDRTIISEIKKVQDAKHWRFVTSGGTKGSTQMLLYDWSTGHLQERPVAQRQLFKDVSSTTTDFEGELVFATSFEHCMLSAGNVLPLFVNKTELDRRLDRNRRMQEVYSDVDYSQHRWPLDQVALFADKTTTSVSKMDAFVTQATNDDVVDEMQQKLIKIKNRLKHLQTTNWASKDHQKIKQQLAILDSRMQVLMKLFGLFNQLISSEYFESLHSSGWLENPPQTRMVNSEDSWQKEDETRLFITESNVRENTVETTSEETNKAIHVQLDTLIANLSNAIKQFNETVHVEWNRFKDNHKQIPFQGEHNVIQQKITEKCTDNELIVMATFTSVRPNWESNECNDLSDSWFKTKFYRVNGTKQVDTLTMPNLVPLTLDKQTKAILLTYRGMIPSGDGQTFLAVRTELLCLKSQSQTRDEILKNKISLSGFNLKNRLFVQKMSGVVIEFTNQRPHQQISIAELLNCYHNSSLLDQPLNVVPIVVSKTERNANSVDLDYYKESNPTETSSIQDLKQSEYDSSNVDDLPIQYSYIDQKSKKVTEQDYDNSPESEYIDLANSESQDVGKSEQRDATQNNYELSLDLVEQDATFVQTKAPKQAVQIKHRTLNHSDSKSHTKKREKNHHESGSGDEKSIKSSNTQNKLKFDQTKKKKDFVTIPDKKWNKWTVIGVTLLGVLIVGYMCFTSRSSKEFSNDIQSNTRKTSKHKVKKLKKRRRKNKKKKKKTIQNKPINSKKISKSSKEKIKKSKKCKKRSNTRKAKVTNTGTKKASKRQVQRRTVEENKVCDTKQVEEHLVQFPNMHEQWSKTQEQNQYLDQWHKEEEEEEGYLQDINNVHVNSVQYQLDQYQMPLCEQSQNCKNEIVKIDSKNNVLVLDPIKVQNSNYLNEQTENNIENMLNDSRLIVRLLEMKQQLAAPSVCIDSWSKSPNKIAKENTLLTKVFSSTDSADDSMAQSVATCGGNTLVVTNDDGDDDIDIFTLADFKLDNFVVSNNQPTIDVATSQMHANGTPDTKPLVCKLESKQNHLSSESMSESNSNSKSKQFPFISSTEDGKLIEILHRLRKSLKR